MSGEKKETGLRKALFLGFLVVGSVVIFVLGVMTGSNIQLPPDAIRGAGSRAEKAAKEEPFREVVPLPGKGEAVKGEEMTFYDTLDRDRERIAPEAPAAPSTPVVPTPPAVQPALIPQEGTEGAPPEEQTAQDAPPASAGKKSAGRTYSIQALLTSDQTDAKAAASRLAKIGFNAYVVPRNTARGKAWAVRVGKNYSETEARKMLAELKKKTPYKDGFLVKE